MSSPTTENRGDLFPIVLAGPSGGGKTTVRTVLLERMTDLVFSVSATTRKARSGEVDGRDYQFMDRGSFKALIDSRDFLEWTEVHGELYGTPRDNLRGARSRGACLLLDIDVQGARQLRAIEPDAVMIFLLPPDLDSLIQRLGERGSEDHASLRRRMRTALAELQYLDVFDYLVVNEDLDMTLASVEGIIASERSSVKRLSPEARDRVRDLGESLNRMLEASVQEEVNRT